MLKEAGYPELFLADTRPTGPPLTVVCSHAVAEQVSKVSKGFPVSVNKSPTTFEFTRLIGYETILLKEARAVTYIYISCSITNRRRVMLGNLSGKGSTLDLHLST